MKKSFQGRAKNSPIVPLRRGVMRLKNFSFLKMGFIVFKSFYYEKN
jgi:hypothetical protein